jgi:hypothetical protein
MLTRRSVSARVGIALSMRRLSIHSGHLNVGGVQVIAVSNSDLRQAMT